MSEDRNKFSSLMLEPTGDEPIHLHLNEFLVDTKCFIARKYVSALPECASIFEQRLI